MILLMLYFCMNGLLVGFSNLGCQHVFLIIVKQKGQVPIIDGSLELNVGVKQVKNHVMIWDHI